MKNPKIVPITTDMRARYLLLAILFPTLLFGAGRIALVQVAARVPLVAAVDGPAQVVLAPGEVVRVRVRVSTNVRWVLDVYSPNVHAMLPASVNGTPGGTAENSREVLVGCSSQAEGPQTIALVYTLMPR